MAESVCPICASFDDQSTYRTWLQITPKPTDRTLAVTCFRCGQYEIRTDIASDRDGKAQLKELALQLSAATRYANDEGSSLVVGYDNVATVAAKFVKPRERGIYFDRVLEQLAGKQEVPGLPTPQLHRAEIAARVLLPDEAVGGVLLHLKKIEMIRIDDLDPIRLRVELTPAGWKRADEFRKAAGGLRNRAFVAMWFDNSIAAAYGEGILPALRNAGYEPPFRVDDPEHDEEDKAGPFIPRIDDRIMAGIRRSRFVVVDVTGHRPSVYYEAGFAEGLDIPIFWCCRREAKEVTTMAFDTRQNEHIFWADPEELRTRLEAKIIRRGWWLK